MAVNGNEPISAENLKAALENFKSEMAQSSLGKDISAYSWGELIELAKNPATSGSIDYLVGQTRAVYLSGYGNFDFQLIGINHDDLADGSGKASMTFMAVDCVTTHRMNASQSTSGGWASSEMRTFLNGDIYNSLPDYLKEYVKEVKKPYCATSGGSVSTANDKVFLASEKEVFGTTSHGDEGSQYAYWAQNNNNNARIKKYGGNDYYWWLRSVWSSTTFCIVYNGGNLDGGSAISASGCVPCFCI